MDNSMIQDYSVLVIRGEKAGDGFLISYNNI